eukprot:82031-Karenia_brevis.AAC.1
MVTLVIPWPVALMLFLPWGQFVSFHRPRFPMVGNWAGAHVTIGGIDDPCPATPPEPGVTTACAP